MRSFPMVCWRLQDKQQVWYRIIMMKMCVLRLSRKSSWCWVVLTNPAWMAIRQKLVLGFYTIFGVRPINKVVISLSLFLSYVDNSSTCLEVQQVQSQRPKIDLYWIPCMLTIKAYVGTFSICSSLCMVWFGRIQNWLNLQFWQILPLNKELI